MKLETHWLLGNSTMWLTPSLCMADTSTPHNHDNIHHKSKLESSPLAAGQPRCRLKPVLFTCPAVRFLHHWEGRGSGGGNTTRLPCRNRRLAQINISVLKKPWHFLLIITPGGGLVATWLTWMAWTGHSLTREMNSRSLRVPAGWARTACGQQRVEELWHAWW